MSARATEILFMPGFDGIGELRADFVAALSTLAPARSITYPNRMLESLNGYARFAALQVSPASRPLLVAESFSGLVAARWAAKDPHVAGVVLCGAFASCPVPWASFGASIPGVAQFVGANFMSPIGFVSTDPARRRWSNGLATALRALDRNVLGERMRIIATEDITKDLAAIKPLIVAQFEDDLVIGRDARARLEAACGQATIVRIPGPHYTIEIRPREAADKLRAHIAALFA